MNYQQALSFLQSFPDSERGSSGLKPERNLKMPLSSMRTFLDKIGNPQNIAKTIHITGSKGKGSTATFITSILHHAGFRTALFTSPHLHSYTERFSFNMQPVSDNLFSRGLGELKPLIDEFEAAGGVFSTFGILTALFFHLVKESNPPIDWQVVEVGLGGKDDLTNVFEKKEAAIIAPISLEHTAILGNTKLDIAKNKAGIITTNCLTVLASQPDHQVEELIKNICLDKKSLFVSATKDNIPCKIKMHGNHQLDNAKTAYTLAKTLQEKYPNIADKAILDGISSAILPGRFEIINTNIVLDCAHNGDSALALSQTLQSVFPDWPVIFILGVNEDKNLEDIFWALKNKAKKIIATRSNNYRASSPENIRDRVSTYDSNMEIICKNNIEEALLESKKDLSPNTVICVCGSFYLVAEARQKLLNK